MKMIKSRCVLYGLGLEIEGYVLAQVKPDKTGYLNKVGRKGQY